MQAHSSTYDRILVGGSYSVENRIDMYDRPTKNQASKLTVALSSTHPPSGGLLITKRIWESNLQYGSRNGSFTFTYASGVWYYNYGRTGQQALSGSIQSLGITPAGRGTWQWTNGDIITVTRYEKTRQLIHTFYADEIVSINPTWNVFTQDTPGIGGCYSAQNRIQLRTANTNIPTMAEFRVFKRITNSSQTSEWLPHGTFYVDTREPDSDLGTTSFVCYDAMLMTEQIYRDLSGIDTWPAADNQVIQDICSLIGIGFDPREWSALFASKVDYPNDKTMREILGEIATAHCGNFIISYKNQLRFVPFIGSGGSNIYSLDSKWEEFELQEPFRPYRQVNLWYDDEHAFSYPYPILDGDAWDDSALGKTNGDFALVYTEKGGNPGWKYGDTVIRLGDCGISYIGQPREGDTIQITRDQDISIRAQRDGRTDDIPVNLMVWDISDLGGHNGTYTFQYIADPKSPESAGWYYGNEYVRLSNYGISFSGNSENGDSIKIIRFDGERPTAQVSSDSTQLSLSIDVDVWEDSSYGGTDGTYRFTYQNTIKITQQQSGTLIPTPLSAGNMRLWDSAMGTADGTYILTYQSHIWTLTSGPSEDIGSSYVLASIGLSFSGIPQNGDTITVIRDGTQKAWRDGAITVNMTTLGISISGAISIDDIIYVRRYMEAVNDITGTVNTCDISLEIDIDSWEKTGLGKKDGAYIFRYNSTTKAWTYYTGGILVPITLSEYGIHYDLLPDNLDTITVTRDSGLTDINAYAVVSDRILNGNCSWATQEMVNRIYNAVNGYIYRPYSARTVIIDPALEPGDKIKRTGTDILSFILGSIDADQDILYSADISAPADEEVNHEYEYKSQTQKDLSRKVTLGEFYYGTSISREKGIVIERSDGQSEAIFNSDIFAMRSMVDGVMQDRVFFDPQKGDYIFSGALAADAVFTESLYAEQGVIAELTVDRLTTSRRIREYLLDTYYRGAPSYAEDNYIQIQDYHIKWITGSVNKDENENPIIIQAIDRNGSLLFWDGMVHGCTADGYPLGEDGNQLYSTETDTGFPVQVYQYTEFAKMQGLFESDGINYAPKMIFGTGDQNGNNICHIYKATDGLHIDYKNSKGNIDTIVHYDNEDFWRLSGVGIAPVDELPEVQLHDVIYLTPEEEPNPFFFVAESPGSTITTMVTGRLRTIPALEYSIDNGTTWTEFFCNDAPVITLANVGDRVYLRGDNERLSESIACTRFILTGSVSAHGSIEYLRNKNGKKSPLTSYCYSNLFSECTSLTMPPELPATALAEGCYDRMFFGCDNLMAAPGLPARALAKQCYSSMFHACSGLTTAPELPATTLADNCYSSMFYLCTSLTNAPALPATRMASRCYQEMFHGCSNLVNAPALPAVALAERCYYRMFYGCDNLMAAPALPATAMVNECYREMFYACDNLATAPELPASSLAPYCYYSMFDGCKHLNAAPALPAVSLTDHCYANMFYNCAALTTAPELPAMTLANNCYSNMFYLCGGLITAPELPAMELAPYCYNSMFAACANLNAAPALPAVSLTDHCYANMFYNCTALATAPELPATTLAAYCYQYMFRGCTALTTAPELPATALATYCYEYMFYNCTALTTAPELPAVILEDHCYASMFLSCRRLKYIKVAFTDWQSGTSNWMDGVSASGTFVCAAELPKTRGRSNIPTGWTIQEIQYF